MCIVTLVLALCNCRNRWEIPPRLVLLFDLGLPCATPRVISRGSNLFSRGRVRIESVPGGCPLLFKIAARLPAISPPFPGLCPRLRMDVSMDTDWRNLPEMLARDLAESESVFLARSRTAGPPVVTLAFERQSPQVPQRKPSCVATPGLHRTTSDTDLCSLGQDSATSFGRYEEEQDVHKDMAAPLGTLRTLRRIHTAGVKKFHLKMENDKDERRVFLNGFDEEWGSDSSADMEAGRRSSPSARLRQQSVTTAATSVEVQSVAGAKVHGGEKSMCESWVDLEARESDSEAGLDRGVAGERCEVGNVARPCYASEFEQAALVSVPQRRSSLSHQVTTTTAVWPTREELSTRLLQLPPQNDSHYFTSEPASSPIVRLGRRQAYPNHQFHDDVNTTPFDPLPPSPALSAPEQHSSTSSPRKSSSISRMPFLTHVNSWLEAGSNNNNQRHCPAHTPTSPISGAPITNIRVSTEVLENLRIMVHGFPDTMLSTDCLTVQTIQSYARKLRIGDIKNERLSPRGSDELSIAKSHSLFEMSPQALERKGSFGNLKLMTSLRGKLSSRFVPSPTSSSSRENSEEPWPPVDNRSASLRCNSSPSRPSDKPEKDRYITALRSIFPTGTDYLLDALYAHIIAYNYINSLCGGFPHLHQNGAGPRLPSRPSTNFVVPAGVTSLADLQLHEDAGESVMGDFHRDVARGGGGGSSHPVVPSKAAAMLGLGSTNMGQPLRPAPGTLGGRSTKLRKTTPPGASFAASLESEATLRHLRDNIARNIYRLVETVKSCSSVGKGSAASVSSHEDEDGGCVMGPNGKALEPTLMRAMCEVVRCYEELNA